jgi:hypothetical protein
MMPEFEAILSMNVNSQATHEAMVRNPKKYSDSAFTLKES